MSKVVEPYLKEGERLMPLDAFQPKPSFDMSSIASVYEMDDTFV
jgi:hypothetical protein